MSDPHSNGKQHGGSRQDAPRATSNRAGASVYTSEFFLGFRSTALRSARAVVPIVNDILHPGRVVDVGCGLGAWLRAFIESGVADVRGIDGAYIDRSRLLIEPDLFTAHDVTYAFPELGRFDLAVSLEVAEHLPESSADRFVAELVRLAPAVLFSAAIPYQGGRNHLNEQWPEYWAWRFQSHGYVPLDVVRPAIWNSRDVAYYYAQNTILYLDESQLTLFPSLRPSVVTDASMLARVHPRCWLAAKDESRQSMRWLLRSLRRTLLSKLTPTTATARTAIGADGATRDEGAEEVSRHG